jgi:hypothetical protein
MGSGLTGPKEDVFRQSIMEIGKYEDGHEDRQSSAEGHDYPDGVYLLESADVA